MNFKRPGQKFLSCLVLVLSIFATATLAQDELPRSQVLTLDQDRLFSQSAFGRRVSRDLRSREEALARENRQIEAALIDEEQRLTDERPTMEPTAFRELAVDFDERVTAIRAAQRDKLQAIRDFAESEQARFLQLAIPVLSELVGRSGAAVLLDSNTVLFSVGQIEITDLAIRRIDEEIGEAPLPEDIGPSPTQRPTPEASLDEQ